jgi:hypothetical protein
MFLEYRPLFLGILPQLCTGRHALSDYFKRLNQLDTPSVTARTTLRF